MNKILLKVEDLVTVFPTKNGPFKAIDGISYHINEGETLGIVGESGSGKSVTCFSLMGILSEPGKVESGKIIFDNTDLLQVSEKKMQSIRGHQMAMIFQEPMNALNPVMTIGKQIVEQIQTHEKISELEAKEKALYLINRVGIPVPKLRFDCYPHELSGGMRQRAMIAMALSCRPKLLIADEPTTALDVTIQAQILDLLLELQDEYNMAIQFITHDLGVISEIADRVIVMYGGSILEEGPCAEVFSNPKHPYTKMLLSAVPRLDQIQNLPFIIEKGASELKQSSQGCKYHNLCSLAEEKCGQEIPNPVEWNKNHFVSCHNAEL